MLTAKVFQSGNSQAIRIPNEYRTDKRDYSIARYGDILILMPSDDPWAALRDSIGEIPSDFMTERSQPPMQEREVF